MNLVPALWSYPQSTPIGAGFVLHHFDPADNQLKDSIHYEDTRTEFTGGNGFSTQTGFTDLPVHIATYWLKQDTINWSTKSYVEIADGARFVVGPGPFVLNLADAAQAGLSFISVDVAHEPNSESHKRLGNSLIGRYGWVAFELYKGGSEAPFWVNASGQVFRPRGRSGVIHGFAYDCQLIISAGHRFATTLAYRIQPGSFRFASSPEDNPVRYGL